MYLVNQFCLLKIKSRIKRPENEGKGGAEEAWERRRYTLEMEATGGLGFKGA